MIRYKGNPFIDVLPPRFDSKEFFSKVLKRPNLMQMPECSPADRKAALNDLIYHYFEPQGRHFHLYEKLVDVIYEGYKVRSPESLIKIIKSCEEWNNNKKIAGYCPPLLSNDVVHGFSLVGVSGVGKTTAINKVLKLFPQIVRHQNIIQTQVTYLKINCSEKGSTKQLCLDFFHQLDKVLGTDYFNKFHNTKYTEEGLMIQMANVSALHCLGALIIDEIQNISVTTQNGRDRMLNFFKNLNNCVGVPIILIGTPEANEVLQGNFQQARRSKGIGSLVWDRIQEHESEWERLINKIWKLQVLQMPGELTDDLKKCYFYHSQGIFDVLITLHVCAQKRALDHKLETLNVELVNSTAETELAPLQRMLAALRTRDPRALEKYQDINIGNVQLQSTILESKVAAEPVSKEVERLILRALAILGHSCESEIRTLAEKIVKLFPEQSEEDNLKQLQVILAKGKAKKPRASLPRRKAKTGTKQEFEVNNSLSSVTDLI